ncbi:MAG: hypothetical protein N3D16_09750 [Anaerolineales bacterium]|nr:hypothetical protein [Anaerolineales bacterium]
MLARYFEAQGFATVLITNMPYWAEKIGVPRTYAVEHPFGQPIGKPNDHQRQRQVLLHALSMLLRAEEPGEIWQDETPWDEPLEEAIRKWQPLQPSPILRHLQPRIRDLIRHKGQFRV